MRIDIVGKNLEVTDAIRSRIEARFEKLQKWQVALINPHFVISEQPDNKCKIEANVGIPGGNLVASSEHEDMYAAINELGQKLEKQLNKKAHKGEARRASHATVDVNQEEDLSDEGTPV